MELLNQKGRDHLQQSIEKTPIPNTENYIGVVKFKDGKYGVFESDYAARCIAWMNSGNFNDYYEDGSIVGVVGVKEVTEERSLDSVVQFFKDKVGADNVYSQRLVFT